MGSICASPAKRKEYFNTMRVWTRGTPPTPTNPSDVFSPRKLTTTRAEGRRWPHRRKATKRRFPIPLWSSRNACLRQSYSPRNVFMVWLDEFQNARVGIIGFRSCLDNSKLRNDSFWNVLGRGMRPNKFLPASPA
jgi:hypothetical protein